MAEERKNSPEEAEKNITEENKKSKLDALLYNDEDEDYDETSDEEEFDSFMEEYRTLIGNKFNSSTTAEAEEIAEEDPEQVLISLPRRSDRKKPSSKKKADGTNPDWDENITLAPESYEDISGKAEEMKEEIPEETSVPEFNIGEEGGEEDGFQISFHFGDDEPIKEKENTEENEESKYDPENPRAIDWVFDIAEMFVFVLLAVMIMTSFFFRHSIVEGSSMMNTLEDGDHLIISDFLYTPERGDIVVFEDYSTFLRKAVVKRVIGLPGDTVEIRLSETGKVNVYLNGELLEEEYAFNAKDCDIDTANFNKIITVPDGEIFVMGDNRYHSTDSRSNGVGTVDIDSILGKVIFRFLPFDKLGAID